MQRQAPRIALLGLRRAGARPASASRRGVSSVCTAPTTFLIYPPPRRLARLCRVRDVGPRLTTARTIPYARIQFSRTKPTSVA